jgi:predicted RNA-binding Zn ribbon-like protein
MDFGHYAESAASLVSADLGSVESLQDYLVDRDWLVGQVAASDLRPLRKFQTDLGAVIDDSAAGNEAAVVDGLNQLLVQHPVRPRISGHDAQTWHLHVNDTKASVTTILAAEGLFGMALVVTELGADRFGRCAAQDCNNAYLDSSANRSKRFCSARCASRTNVAAYRSRRQAEA